MLKKLVYIQDLTKMGCYWGKTPKSENITCVGKKTKQPNVILFIFTSTFIYLTSTFILI